MKEGFGSWRRKRLVSSTKGKEKKSSSQMWRWGRIVTFPHPFSESMGKEHTGCAKSSVTDFLTSPKVHPSSSLVLYAWTPAHLN